MKNVVMASVLGTSLLLTSPVANVLSPNMTIQAKAATSQFKDVPTNHVSYEAIVSLVNKKVVFGFPDGSFKPEEGVTRGQFASMLARALNLPKADSNFKDVPKKSALYDGISKAAAAGLVLGNNGSFSPNSPVSNADVAAMLDRMMNRKGSFNETVELPYKDKSKITKYALESIKKMTRYGVMTGINNEFKPSSNANRGETSLYIYRALNLIEAKPPVAEKNYKDMTVAEIKAIVGEYTVVERITSRFANKSIQVRDFVEEYYEDLHDPIFGKFAKSPQEYFAKKYETAPESYEGFYFNEYPKYELISFNGEAYRNSPLFPERFKNPITVEDHRLNLAIPSQPEQSGLFLLDIHTYSKDAVTYTKEAVKITSFSETPIALNNDFVVDIKKAFSNTSVISVSSDGLTYKNNDKTVKLTNGSNQAMVNGNSIGLPSKVEVKNGMVLGPIKAISTHLGLYSRELSPVSRRVEVANYPLIKGDKWGVWE